MYTCSCMYVYAQAVASVLFAGLGKILVIKALLHVGPRA